MDLIAAAQLEAAWKTLELKWSDHGQCASCGWHSLLSEHDVSGADLAEALEGDGILRLPCLSKDDEDCSSHRGVEINLRKTRAKIRATAKARYPAISAAPRPLLSTIVAGGA